MLRFDRKEFRSGTIIVREMIPGKEQVSVPALDEQGKEMVDANGNKISKISEKDVMVEKQYLFTVKDKGKDFDGFHDEAAVLAKYGNMFTKV